MNYERLKTFLAVADKRSFSEAAKILHVTQPSVTIQIKELEMELDTRLFERSTKQVKLTPSAGILLNYATEIVRLGELAKKDILEAKDASCIMKEEWKW
ncbi:MULTISPECIES: LysR family transcriptional regulator [Virgibacillus]|uniref:CysJI operon transcriptional activator n=2 Tax=Virgibacillus TaxID=84406 RepID=A0A024Q8D7_9BACI|nr:MULTISPECIES: LysR family transcriptional regulator [Virgibacillus]EQB37665.1 hypothetical protein M948_03680 [Virgibacillus sp. CM-4]MYL40404.1 LysR family transcriptional regulator [Virgibacillus massiliensis]GGJ59304.1 hypothetical protein GCM10007111_21580 [Virgibacillus kapii]CDQ38808.1 CysJI operon transcriptional activator [Virgibacillus massiliensis]